MKKETKNVLRIIAIVLFILISFSNFIYADEIINSTSEYDFRQNVTNGDVGKLTIVSRVLGVIQVIGTIVSVVCLMAIGIKYMVGSAEEKATYKKSMIPYIIGAVILFGSSNLLSILYDVINGIK